MDSPVGQTVTVVGAGVAGAACAVALIAADVPVRVVERGRAPGGRMASPEVQGRRVDLGAGYFTVKDDGFSAVVDGWEAAGLARPWTDTFSVLTRGAEPSSSSGPVRWATPGGLRSLVRALLDGAGVEVEYEVVIESPPEGPVVLAMPDPQAQRIFAAPELRFVDYDPVIAVACGFDERRWSVLHDAAFVNDHPDVSFIADDGARRGDGAPVLVAHTTPERARKHLVMPDDAARPVVAALTELLGTGEPLWTHTHRWTFAKPADAHEHTFHLHQGSSGAPVGLAGDQWCPEGSPRVESAWRSGTDLGRALVAAL
ncbi:NAD(P)/FAD-dependent oxidoreductase [Jatrophihabitans sp. YIM 134969]